VSSEWRPDDSQLERTAEGPVRGVRRAQDALKKHKIPYKDRVITSRDAGMAAVRRDLKRNTTLCGVQQWQIPILMNDELVWVEARHKPGATIPAHSHNGWVLHIVISGAMRHKGRTLKPGDWILVPPGKSYSLTVVGPGEARTCYVHQPTPLPGPGPVPRLKPSGPVPSPRPFSG